ATGHVDVAGLEPALDEARRRPELLALRGVIADQSLGQHADVHRGEDRVTPRCRATSSSSSDRSHPWAPPTGSTRRQGMVDHVTIRLLDRQASERFFDAVMTPLGIQHSYRGGFFSEWQDFSIAEATDSEPATHGLHVA